MSPLEQDEIPYFFLNRRQVTLVAVFVPLFYHILLLFRGVLSPLLSGKNKKTKCVVLT